MTVRKCVGRVRLRVLPLNCAGDPEGRLVRDCNRGSGEGEQTIHRRITRCIVTSEGAKRGEAAL